MPVPRRYLDQNPESRELLLAEIEDALRIAPSFDEFAADGGGERQVPWLGRAAAAIERWDFTKTPIVSAALQQVPSELKGRLEKTLSTMKTLLHQARSDLRMELHRTSVLVPAGQVFEYFDELRKLLETARTEVFFVDPYLDAEFVSRYLPHVAKDIRVRLLGQRKIASLVSAADVFMQQTGARVAIRSAGGLHDRYVFIDKTACYVSGASFKDGAKNAPVGMTQIIDAFAVTLETYERIWSEAKIEREVNR